MNPFQDETLARPDRNLRPKRTSSTNSVSRIHGMTVGDVRQCFSQMRVCPNMTHKSILWYGITAGKFSMLYLLTPVNKTGPSPR